MAANNARTEFAGSQANADNDKDSNVINDFLNNRAGYNTTKNKKNGSKKITAFHESDYDPKTMTKDLHDHLTGVINGV